MRPNQPPFKSDYVTGEETTSTSLRREDTARRPAMPQQTVETTTVGASVLPPIDAVMEEVRRYGTGRPKFVVIRGKISRD
jgi:hypothetical protein